MGTRHCKMPLIGGGGGNRTRVRRDLVLKGTTGLVGVFTFGEWVSPQLDTPSPIPNVVSLQTRDSLQGQAAINGYTLYLPTAKRQRMWLSLSSQSVCRFFCSYFFPIVLRGNGTSACTFTPHPPSKPFRPHFTTF